MPATPLPRWWFDPPARSHTEPGPWNRGGWGGHFLVSHSFFSRCYIFFASFSGTSRMCFLWLSESLAQFCRAAKGNLLQSQLKPFWLRLLYYRVHTFSSWWVWRSSERMKCSIENISSDSIAKPNQELSRPVLDKILLLAYLNRWGLNGDHLNNWNLRRTTISSLRSTWESVEFIVQYIYTNRQENILVPALQWLS